MARARQAIQPAGKQQLGEVRSLQELAARLAELPRAMALVEVRRTNLAETLAWLADAGSCYPRARFVVLVESEGFDHQVRRGVTAALLAAGAVEVADSPRHLPHVLVVGRRHAATQVSPTGPGERQSFAEWARALLPWQPA
jgi:hypothetical protein